MNKRNAATKTSTKPARKPGNSRRAPGIETLTITIDAETRKHLSLLAERENRSVSNYVNTYLWPEIDARISKLPEFLKTEKK